ncbi:molybdate transport repressor ModE-like protein [Agromyces terreus]|uniref:Molybdate transport repressor ModE-like protein n=1 Tax=Agromyces terreus TaxID=424795 RepID=A0A9X2H1T0_9MICO|nr:ABC transporter substrate-binding protein [Agromyces terreus]MCP2371028.1 molybdate transport repressor ModE-like protein [Agromyces terreus]
MQRPNADLESLTRALDLHSLRILSAIERTGSISGAARDLGYSQPAITQHLQRLEARIGAQLVNRTGRAARLSPAGQLLARHTPRIEASLTAAAAELAEVLGRRADSLRIAAFPSALAGVVAPLLARLDLEAPDVDIDIVEADTDQALALVRDGRADIAVLSTPAGAHAHASHVRREGLRSSFLFADDVLAVVPASFRGDPGAAEALGDAAPGGASASTVAGGSRVGIEALADLPWIGGAATCTAQAADAATARGIAHTVAFEVTTPQAALALVDRGRGVAFLSTTALHSVALPEGVRVLGLAPRIRRRVLAVSLAESASIPAIADALRLLAGRPAVAPALLTLITPMHPVSHSHRTRLSSAPFRTAFGAPATTTPHLELETADMPSTTLTRGARAGAAAAGVLLLAACTAGSPADAPAVDSGAEIDSITVALPGSLSNLYVGQESGILNYYIASITQEGLVSVDADGKLQPGLAESWTQPDDVTYVYELRDDAEFQDGTPVTADDVVFSLEQARDETSSPGLSYYLGGVDTVEKTGDHEVTITLAAPDAAFAANMSTGGAAFITSKAFWEANDGAVGTSSSLLLGSGPYEVTEFVPDSHVSFDRVDTWWGELPKVKHIDVQFIPDESTRLLAAQKGDVDVAFNVPLAQSTQWENLDGMRVDYVNDLSYVGLYFNTAIEPFDDPKVREAFAHSVDRDAIVDKLLRGHGEAATAIATPESLGSVYSADEARDLLAETPQWDFDLDAAKAALAASDHPDGFETEILTPNTGPQLGTAAQSLAENLAKIGITLTVREVPIEEWLASLEPDAEYGVGMMWYFSTLGDPAEVSSYMLGADNVSNYANPEIDDLFAQAGAESDPATRIDLLLEAEKLQAEDVINVPLWWGQSATAFADDLGMDDYSSFAFISAWPTTLYRIAG